MPTLAQTIKLTYYLQRKAGGFSESHVLLAPDYAGNLTIATKIIKHRMQCTSNQTTCAYARLSALDSQRGAYPAIDSPMSAIHVDTEAGPPIAIEEAVSPKAAVFVKLHTADGRWANRMFRFIRDSWGVGSTFQVTPTIPAALPADPDGTETKEEAWGNFLYMLLNYTYHLQQDPADVNNYLLTSWAKHTERGMSGRDTGVPFDSRRGRQPALA